MGFVPLHNHSDYSLLDGASQVSKIVERANNLGMKTIALTDHGVMYGVLELVKNCKKFGIKPIIGNEMYIINGSIDDPQPKKEKRYHLVVLAKNLIGYKNLVKLTTLSHLNGMRGRGIFSRPCIDKRLLHKYKEGLIISTACLGGEIPQAILKGRLDVAEDIAKWYQREFESDFYLEIQDHGSIEDRIVNVEIIKIGKKLGIKVIATNDAHYLSNKDVEAHDALLCILTGKLISEKKRLRYTGTEYIKDKNEMLELFQDHIDIETIRVAVQNTKEVSDKVEEFELFGEYRMPKYPLNDNKQSINYLKEVAKEGLQKRLGKAIYDDISESYKNRLLTELQIIEDMGFPDYFLVVWDYIKFARDNFIPVGPGRGSAAGSLVAYSLQITNIDPVKHGLLFERFLNPARKSMPDIDTDFCIDRRNEVIDYVTERYGEEKVAQIITFNKMTSKAVLKDVARVLDIPYGESDKLAKLIPVVRGKPYKLNEMIDSNTPSSEFREKYLNDLKVKRWVDLAIRIEGTNKTYGVHAAGVVIASEPLDELVPLQRNNDGQIITQYSMDDIESLGLLKMDFLGLKNLTMLDKTVSLIESSTGEKINLDNLPENDNKTFDLIGRGDLEGIFQLESSGMKQVVKDFKPSSLEDISSILALYRPGPLDAGLIPKFIKRKNGNERVDYPHPYTETILNETYGIMVYQEQIMKIAQDLAGYSLGEADLLRRAMGKKKVSEMVKHRNIFVEGSVNKGVEKKIANDLFDQMVLFAEYCFNKSHSTAYGAVTYQTAFLKAHFPVAYMAALLSVNAGSSDKMQRYISNCYSMGIEVISPSINLSGIDFTIKRNQILFGLSAIKNLGESAIRNIINNRKEFGMFKSLSDLCDRLPVNILNKRNLESLIHCGCLDEFSINNNRAQLLADLEHIVDWASTRHKDRLSGQGNLFDDNNAHDINFSFTKKKEVDDYSLIEKLKLEKELLGFYLSDHPLKHLSEPAKLVSPVSISNLEDFKDRSKVSLVGMIPEIKLITTRKGDRMAILQLEDLSGSCEAVVFPKTYIRLSEFLLTDTRLLIWGTIDKRSDKTQLILDDCREIDNLKLLIINLECSQASDIRVQNKIRDCLIKFKADREKCGVKTPVLAAVKSDKTITYVKFGDQFCVSDISGAAKLLESNSFKVNLRSLVS
ncbi:MAG: DNA polymerase III subunit alpha [Prochlorococcus sp. SP3034]|nr:DNA polymerase III subunit alpha [Prochlorococcus sp. SP3034]|tara:strand:- start:1383 stop:4877 length:3495 start_codon:yes stop_codon:yes gene_type:complete